jgi:hypothetical protein
LLDELGAIAPVARGVGQHGRLRHPAPGSRRSCRSGSRASIFWWCTATSSALPRLRGCTAVARCRGSSSTATPTGRCW